METVTILAILSIIFALVFDLSNGWNDAANSIATVVSTRVLKPTTALIMSATLNFVGALYSDEVAKTIGSKIFDTGGIDPLAVQVTFLGAVIAAPIWITICSVRGLPISCSHSLMGALVGAGIATAGTAAIKGEGVNKIIFGIFTSPIAGFIVGFLIIMLIYFLCRKWRPRTVTKIYGKLQIVSAGFMSFAHGTGDAQKAMGIITAALIAARMTTPEASGEFTVPLWVRITCGAAIGIGTAIGGWRVMKTLGMKIADLKPYQGFAAETAAAFTIIINTRLGIPISTTHCITGAVLGVGSAEGVKSVRWLVASKVVFAWFVTLPITVAGGFGACWILHVLFNTGV